MASQKFSRREILRVLVGGVAGVSGAALLQACRSVPPPSSSSGATVAPAVAPASQSTPAAQAVTGATPAPAGGEDPSTGPIPFRKDTAAGASTPKRGGTMTTALLADWSAWDPTQAQAIRVGHMFFTSNKLIQGDWTKGPQGDGTTTWEWGYLSDVGLLKGELAESWETPDPMTIIYHLRKGVKFHNKPPVNGRELTADDVVWNINMQLTYPTAWQAMAYTENSGLRPTSVKALDKYTVEVKTPAASRDLMLLEIGCNMYTNPPEVWANGGDMSDWTKVIGSGPWIITNYVAGSEITLSRNPDYFEMDPLHPDQQLPYLDTLKLLIIPDPSSRFTALRTGQIDWLRELAPDDAKPLISGSADLQWSRRIGLPWVASGREDKQNLPFKDIRVRRALNIAVDKQSILKDYLKGEGVLLGYPFPPTKAYEKYFTPLDQLPPDTQELFTGYNPAKAKQLLADAGYPNGFKTKIQGQQAQADEMAMIQAYLAKVGVDMQIQTLDPGQFNSMDAANSQDEMWYGQAKGVWAPNEMLMTKKGMYSNDAIIDDPYYLQVQNVVAEDMVKNPDNYFKTMKEAGVHELQSAWGIWVPVAYQYNTWWPWTQNYYGINWTGWAGVWQWTKYLWIDQNLKKSMGH
jgi:peptide/nickel transport system substrate-binding protein